MANTLRNLRLDRIDLVDAPANPSARVVLVKRDAAHKSSPPLSAVHVHQPVQAPAPPKSRPRGGKERNMAKSKSVLKRLFAAILKGDPALMEAATPPAPPAEDGNLTTMKTTHAGLGDAIKAFGDPSKLPADHPVHQIIAQHKALGDRIAECAAKSADPAEPVDGDPMDDDEDDDPGLEGDGMTKRDVEALVAKRLKTSTVALEKRAAEAETRAAAAETIAKSERDARQLAETRASLTKFAGVGIDVEKDAPVFKSLADKDPAAYARVTELLTAAQAQVAKNDQLTREIGSGQGGSHIGKAWGEIEALAAAIVVKGEKGITKAKAIDRVMADKANYALVQRHLAEENGQVQ